MGYSVEDLIKFLSISNMKLKKIKRNIKNVRIERNKYKAKLKEIEEYLNDNVYLFDKYDYPSDAECHRLSGKIEIKKELLKILNK